MIKPGPKEMLEVWVREGIERWLQYLLLLQVARVKFPTPHQAAHGSVSPVPEDLMPPQAPPYTHAHINTHIHK